MQRLSPIATVVFCILAAGCSGTNNPAYPAESHLTSQACESSAGQNRILWGVWHVVIDPAELTACAVPVRGAMFTCNVTRFMQPPSSPTHMISLAVDPLSEPALGHFIVDVTLRHPFPGLRFYNGFDVRGVFMSDGSVAGEHDSTVLRAGAGDSVLKNADGYTRFWNYTEFTSYNTIFGFTHGKLAPPTHPTATVNPYKYFADGLGKEDAVETLDPATRGFFTAGSANTRRYDIQFKMNAGSPVFDFNYAVDASWEPPDMSYAPNYPVEAFPASANVAEPFHMVFSDAGSTAYYVDPSNKGGEFVFHLEIFDRQAAVNPDGVPGEISAIWLEGEALTSPVDVLPNATVLPGSTSVSSVFEVTLTSLDLTHSGEVEFMATVESANPTTYEPQVGGGNAFAYPDAPLAAYFTFKASVSGTPPLSLKIISPNGGESWAAGTHHEITWDPGNVTGTVFLEYSKDNFVSDVHSIVTGTQNDGSYTWQVPNDPSTTVRVRVSSSDDPLISDKSDADFSITSAQWPTDPVLIDPDHPVYATRFAVDAEGRVHALYTDAYSVWWSYSDDYGNTWTNIETPIYTVPSDHILYRYEIAMDADNVKYVYALFNETDHHPGNIYDPTKCYASIKACRLDITNMSAGWEVVTMWELTTGYDGRQNFTGAQVSVLDSGAMMVTGILYAGTGDFQQYFYYAPNWASIKNAPMMYMDTYIENGYQVYTYPRYTIHLVHDSKGYFYFTMGGNFNDFNSSNGTGIDYGNAILRFDPSVSRWRFIQTCHHDASVQYWLTEARGLAIDDDDNLHWVFLYGYDWYNNQPNCYASAGKWKLCYGTGPASGDHNMPYQDPINYTDFYVEVPPPGSDCAYYTKVWFHTSIGVDNNTDTVYVIYQRAWYQPEIYGVKYNGSTWTSPKNIEGSKLYGDAPWGRMHPSGWFLLTFTDRNTSDPSSSSNLPYFVAWK